MEMLLVYWHVTWNDHNVLYTEKTGERECFAMARAIAQNRVQVIGIRDKHGICHITVFPEHP